MRPNDLPQDWRFLSAPRSYSELIELARARKAALGVSNEILDELAGLPAGYVGKLTGPGQTRRLGTVSWAAFFESLGLRIAVYEDAELTQRLKRRLSCGGPMCVEGRVSSGHPANKSEK